MFQVEDQDIRWPEPQAALAASGLLVGTGVGCKTKTQPDHQQPARAEITRHAAIIVDADLPEPRVATGGNLP